MSDAWPKDHRNAEGAGGDVCLQTLAFFETTGLSGGKVNGHEVTVLQPKVGVMIFVGFAGGCVTAPSDTFGAVTGLIIPALYSCGSWCGIIVIGTDVIDYIESPGKYGE